MLDPTCGSGTTAYVAEQWGRRWITIDTSRVALALARARIMGARYPYYLLADSEDGQVKEARNQPPRARQKCPPMATSGRGSSTSGCPTSPCGTSPTTPRSTSSGRSTRSGWLRSGASCQRPVVRREPWRSGKYPGRDPKIGPWTLTTGSLTTGRCASPGRRR